jgi:uncharacterized protein YuzE
MVALKIQERKAKLNWDYDEDADVLYISFGDPVKAVGLDVGEGVIVRYKEKTGELVGLTIIGLRQRSLTAMGERK